MRTHDPAFRADRSPVAVLGVSVALLCGFLGLLVAAAHPTVAASALAGAATALALRRAAAGLRGRVRVQVDGVRAQARADDVT